METFYKLFYYTPDDKEGHSLVSVYPSLLYKKDVETKPSEEYLEHGFGIYAWSYKHGANCYFNKIRERYEERNLHLWEGEGERLEPSYYGEWKYPAWMKWSEKPTPAMMKEQYENTRIDYPSGLAILSYFIPRRNTYYQPPPTQQEWMRWRYERDQQEIWTRQRQIEAQRCKEPRWRPGFPYIKRTN